MDEERDEINEEEQEETPEVPAFTMHEKAILQGAIAAEDNNQIMDLSYKAYEAGPGAFMDNLDTQLDKLDEAINQTTTEQEYNALVQNRNLILQVQELFPQVAERKAVQQEARKELYDKEFKLAKKTGDWTKVLALKNVIPADLNDIYNEEALADAKKEIIKEAIETGDYSLAGKLNQLLKAPTRKPTVEEIEAQEEAQEAHKAKLHKMMEKARETGDWTAVLRRVGLPH